MVGVGRGGPGSRAEKGFEVSLGQSMKQIKQQRLFRAEKVERSGVEGFEEDDERIVVVGGEGEGEGAGAGENEGEGEAN